MISEFLILLIIQRVFSLIINERNGKLTFNSNDDAYSVFFKNVIDINYNINLLKPSSSL